YAAPGARPLSAHLVASTLCPHDEQGRAGAVLPPQYRSRVEHLLVDSVGGSRIGRVAIVKRCSFGISGELTQVRVGALTEERLGIQLDGEGGRQCVVDAAGERQLLQVQVRERVVRDSVGDGSVRLDVVQLVGGAQGQ